MSLRPSRNSDVGVAERDAFEIVVVGRHQVEEFCAPSPSKITSPSPAPLITIGLSAVPLCGQVVGAVEQRAEREVARVRQAVQVVEAVARCRCRRAPGWCRPACTRGGKVFS